jgi:hypothetical protein
MYVFLTIEEGKYRLKVSGYPASTIGPMHQRGTDFPNSLQPEYDELELAAIGLQDLTEYYKCSEGHRSKQKHGSRKKVEG